MTIIMNDKGDPYKSELINDLPGTKVSKDLTEKS
jgi:hypothetical protein